MRDMASSASTQLEQPDAIQARSQGFHAHYLDGIRGLAALYVLLEHVQLTGLGLIGADKLSTGNESALQHLARLFNSTAAGFGHAAVDVFIVLSGYCLMLPVANSSDHALRGGIGGFFKRRAIRILPPYYAALLIALLVTISAGMFHQVSAWNLIAHLLLIHSVAPRWVFGISAPLWSVAVEWQIYFVFALLLLPVWRRTSNAIFLTFAFVLGLLPIYLMPIHWNLECSCSWYIGLFALGMVAAIGSVRLNSQSAARHARWWGSAAIAGTLLTVAVYLMQRSDHVHAYWVLWFRVEDRKFGWPLDVLSGFVMCCALLSFAGFRASGNRGVAGSLLRHIGIQARRPTWRVLI